MPHDYNEQRNKPDLTAKQDTLVSGTNIKTINGDSVVGSGDLVVTGSGAAWGQITGTLANQTDLNNALAGKEPAKGADDNYVTDAEKVVIGNTSGSNTGDQTIPSAGSTPSTQALGDAPAGGNDATFSKNDHKHGMPTLASILLACHPVGEIYQSEDSTSPATLFGGTWIALGAGRVLVGIDAGDTDFDTAEETGGAKAVDLSHTHDAHGFTQPTAHGITQPAIDNHAAHTHAPGTLAGANVAASVKIGTGATSATGAHTTTITGATDNPSATLTHNLGTQVALTNNHAGGAVTPTTHASNLSATQSVVQPYIVCYRWKRTA